MVCWFWMVPGQVPPAPARTSPKLFAVPVVGGSVAQLLTGPSSWPTWSGDGLQFAYFGRFGIHVRDLATGHERQISIPDRICRTPSYCVDLDWQH